MLLGRVEDQRSAPSWCCFAGIGIHLALLGFFKYFGFFAENLQALLALAGWRLDPSTLKVLLPVGISFYTFIAMSYVIDVYRRQIEPCPQPDRLRRLHRVLPARCWPGRSCGRPALLRQIALPRSPTATQAAEGALADPLGLLQEDVRGRQPGARGRPGVRRGTRPGGLAICVGDRRVRVPDLRRFLGLLGHRPRHRRSCSASS